MAGRHIFVAESQRALAHKSNNKSLPSMKNTFLSRVIASLILVALSYAAAAADGPPPPSVNQPAGINLGGTSFYDGFAGPPGINHLVYLKHDRISSFRDAEGKENRVFDDPQLNVTTLLNQISYYSPETIGGGAHLGWNVIIPLVSLDGDFGDGGPKLKDNSAGLGDITAGIQLQFDPIVDGTGRRFGRT